MKHLLKPSLDWLLAALPIAAYLHYTHGDPTWIFITACIAIIPIAGWMGHATEHLAERTGEGIGGLLNATFGNAAELIIALIALSAGKIDVVKASITGSIIGNVLLVLGAAFLFGGMRHARQQFSLQAARSYGTMLLLAAIALVVPAAFHHLAVAPAGDLAVRERDLSLEIAVVLFLTYLAVLWFSLRTHKHLFTGPAAEAAQVSDHGPGDHGPGGTAPAAHAPWSVGKAVTVLVVATVAVAIVAEWMIHSVEGAAHTLGMNQIFIGVVVVAIVGNAAEHSSAILMARKNRMDLAIGIALGSSIQVALFVAPVLVFASYLIAPAPLDLVFTPLEVLAVVAAVWVAAQVTNDGESNWLEGLQLISVYAILAGVFYLLPSHPAPSHPPAIPAALPAPGH
ncbi:calcium/proton exchanger [Planctomycetota bacterium]|nr:calcium/proton exchanger [Planctomycetota bacterium]